MSLTKSVEGPEVEEALLWSLVCDEKPSPAPGRANDKEKLFFKKW